MSDTYRIHRADATSISITPPEYTTDQRLYTLDRDGNIQEIRELVLPSGRRVFTSKEKAQRAAAEIKAARGEKWENMPTITKTIFSQDKTIVFWDDGTKTVVSCAEDDEFNPWVGVAMCIVKKALGNTGKYNDVIDKAVNEAHWEWSDEEKAFIKALGLDKLADVLAKQSYKRG